MTEQSPKESSRTVLEVKEPRKRAGWQRMGGWAVAQSPILGTTIKVALLKRKGYVPLIDYYSKVKLSI